MLLGIALAGTSAYFLKTWWGGDTIIGALLSTAVGAGPLPGAIAGALVPSADNGFRVPLISPMPGEMTYGVVEPPFEGGRKGIDPGTTPAGAPTA
jgi:hypothetical protein